VGELKGLELAAGFAIKNPFVFMDLLSGSSIPSTAESLER
jgi:hypothetical protein